MKQGCSVFVGNIDFNIDEQKVIEELSAVGRVVSFRMMYDKATGRSKGYGFCEYESPLIAEAAMKTLKISFNGRPVKINYAENDLPTKPKEAISKSLEIENIISVLDKFDKENLLKVMDYLKKMAIGQPTQLKELFDKNPNLVLAIVMVFLKLDLAPQNEILKLVEDSFDVEKQQLQIAHRIETMENEAVEGLTEDIKSRLDKIRELLVKQRE